MQLSIALALSFGALAASVSALPVGKSDLTKLLNDQGAYDIAHSERRGEDETSDGPGYAIALERRGEDETSDGPGYAIALETRDKDETNDGPGYIIALERRDEDVTSDGPGYIIAE